MNLGVSNNSAMTMPFIKAFALLLCTGEFSEVRLFLRKKPRRHSLLSRKQK
jgi:hypothetical protein